MGTKKCMQNFLILLCRSVDIIFIAATINRYWCVASGRFLKLFLCVFRKNQSRNNELVEQWDVRRKKRSSQYLLMWTLCVVEILYIEVGNHVIQLFVWIIIKVQFRLMNCRWCRAREDILWPIICDEFIFEPRSTLINGSWIEANGVMKKSPPLIICVWFWHRLYKNVHFTLI